MYRVFARQERDVFRQKLFLQSSQVKHTPQGYVNEFIVRKFNPLVVVDFSFISAFLHV